ALALISGIVLGQHDSSDEDDEEWEAPNRVFHHKCLAKPSVQCGEPQAGPSYEYSEPQQYVPQESGTERDMHPPSRTGVNDQQLQPEYEQPRECDDVRTQIQEILPAAFQHLRSKMKGARKGCDIDPTFVEDMMSIMYVDEQPRECSMKSFIQQLVQMVMERLENMFFSTSDLASHASIVSDWIRQFVSDSAESRECEMDRTMENIFTILQGDLEIVNTGPIPISENDPVVAYVMAEAFGELTKVLIHGKAEFMDFVPATLKLFIRQSLGGCKWFDGYKMVYNHDNSTLSFIQEPMENYASGLRQDLLSTPFKIVHDIINNENTCDQGPDIPFPEELTPFVALFKLKGKKSSKRGELFKIKDTTKPVYTHKHHGSPDALIKRFLENIFETFVKNSEKDLPEAKRKSTVRELRLFRWFLISVVRQAREILGPDFIYSVSQIAEDKTELGELISGLASFPAGDFFLGPSPEMRGPYDPSFFDLEDFPFDHAIKYFIGREHYEALYELHQRVLQFVVGKEKPDPLNCFEILLLISKFITALQNSNRPIIPITSHSDFVDITLGYRSERGQFESERERFEAFINRSKATDSRKAKAKKKLASIPDTKIFRIPKRQKEELDGITDDEVTTQVPRRSERAVNVYAGVVGTCTSGSAFGNRQLNRLIRWIKEEHFLQLNRSSINNRYPSPWSCALKKLKAAYY
ncbi:hypothetical protein QAD02_017927, partial [Eretmocerus hayati]